MNVYKIKDAFVHSQHVDINRLFLTRNDALNYMFKYLNHLYIYNVEVEEEYPQDNKHDIHYVINQYNSFNVTRTTI